jgi:hypothetical protein
MPKMTEFGRGAEPRYVALIGDVVASRRIAQRAKFQQDLRNLVGQLNQRFASALIGPLTLLKGDELQALFSQPLSGVRVVIELADLLFPERIRWGFGYGPLATEKLPETAQMDGPCFHHARSALEAAQKTDCWLVARGFGETAASLADLMITDHFALMGAVRNRWTERQAEFVRAARSSLQKNVAKKLGVSPSVVSESLKLASFAILEENEGRVMDLIWKAFEEPEFRRQVLPRHPEESR